jgi:quinol monooxygenase YgiN
MEGWILETTKAGPMTEEIRVVAILQARPGKEGEISRAIQAVVPASRAEAGCRFYACHTDQEVAGRFVFVERWDSLDALQKHAQAEHFNTFVATITPLLAGELQVMKLREMV